MRTAPSPRPLPRAQALTEKAFAAFERFLHIEASSGIVLLLAATLALAWANSPGAHDYHALWEWPVTLGLGGFIDVHSLHFWINDGLMTVFFLVVGLEIRREIHAGSLSNLRQALLPMVAAVGAVAVPALIYVGFNADPARHHGWAVPTATDIAFAVGVLALLGRSLPGSVRMFLLTLAVIDDVIAVLIIAVFYSGGLDWSGFLVVGLGVLMVLGMQSLGIGAAFAYVFPGAVVWLGFLMTGAHPTLAGVVLGLLTPVVPRAMREAPRETMARAAERLADGDVVPSHLPLRQWRMAERELLPPATRLIDALHPWVAFGIMPLFALANAGVSLQGTDLAEGGSHWVMAGVAVALVLGKPVGVFATTWLLVKLRLCRLPAGMDWSGTLLVGLLAGIGFTMSIFIAMLAFHDPNQMAAAKLGVLLGSLVAAVLGLGWGWWRVRGKPSARSAGAA